MTRGGRWLGMIALVTALVIGLWSWPSRAEDVEDRYVVVKTKKAITITGDEIEDALIVIKGGRIQAVGKKVDYPSESRVIDASHLIAMPGMINPNTTIGLPSIRRSGNRSNKKISDLYYPPDDDSYEKLLKSGYILLGLYVEGSGLPGQGLVQRTHEPKAKDGVKTEGLIRITFNRPSRDKKVLRGVLKEARAEIEKEKAREEAASKPASKPATQPAKKKKPTTQPASGPTSQPKKKPTSKPATKPAPPKIKPELAPIVSLLKNTKGYLAHVEFSRASDVVHFADVVKDIEFPRAYVFTGRSASDVHYVIDHDLLGGANALIALQPTTPYMPLTVNPYNPARAFSEAGCEVALFPAADTVAGHEKMRERLALLVRAGLDRKDALKGVTLYAAKFLTLDKDYGSIEKDKRADLIFLDGDPLDPFARVRRVMIDGEMVLDLDKSAS